jgi:hypothetical protein
MSAASGKFSTTCYRVPSSVGPLYFCCAHKIPKTESLMVLSYLRIVN